MYRVGAQCDYTDAKGNRICAYEEFDQYGDKLEHTVRATYLNSKRQDDRTEQVTSKSPEASGARSLVYMARIL